RQPQKALDRDRNCAVEIKTLRYIADDEAGATLDRAAVGSEKSEQDTDQGCLAGPIRADQRHDLAGAYIDVNVRQDRATTTAQREPGAPQQRLGVTLRGDSHGLRAHGRMLVVTARLMLVRHDAIPRSVVRPA